MKKWYSMFLVICLFLVMIPGSVFAQEVPTTEISSQEAIAAALYQVVLDQQTNEDSPWKNKNITALNPVNVYDASDELVSYIVNLDYEGRAIGFVEIGNNNGDFPVLSYGYRSNQMNESEVKEFNLAVGQAKVNKRKIVSLAPGKFGIKNDFPDGSAVIISKNEQIKIDKKQNIKLPKQVKSVNVNSKFIWKQINELVTGDIGNNSDGVTDDLSFETGWSSSTSKKISGVGDANQYKHASLWTGWSGCSPTSAYNVLFYWHYQKNKTNLLKNSAGYVDKDSAIKDLRAAMGTTTTSNGEGSTQISKIAAGIKKYIKDHGYSSPVVTEHTSPSWSTVKSDLANPTVITFTNQTFYSLDGGHTVTGIGYKEFTYNGSSSGHQYMLIHDNWDITPEDVYVAYGRNYSKLWSIYISI